MPPELIGVACISTMDIHLINGLLEKNWLHFLVDKITFVICLFFKITNKMGTTDHSSKLDEIFYIRDNQGKVKDYVNYFKSNTPSEEKAKLEGILRQALGRRAYTSATKWGKDVIASHSTSIISDEV